MWKKNFRCSKDIHTSCCFTRFVLIWTRIASGKLILLRRRILSVYLLHHAVRRSGLDRFSRIAKVKGEIGRKIEKEKERRRERKRKRERKRERESTWRMKNFTRLRVGRNLLVRRCLRNLLLVAQRSLHFSISGDASCTQVCD